MHNLNDILYIHSDHGFTVFPPQRADNATGGGEVPGRY